MIAVCLLLAQAATAAAESSAEMISSFRLKHGEVRVARDATLDRIAQAQARAMAEKDELSHEVLGSFSSRIASSRAGRAAENIAYGRETFAATLDQWIASSEHRSNLLLSSATRVGIASAKSAASKRTYWAMEIAGDYQSRKGGAVADASKQGPLVQREVASASRRKSDDCHIKLLSLCL
ncbi:MAG: CAP domain-containing protein [Bradyrhizobium sp.]|nr:CAP domain-containing protein [Bradyrhizobium sp.]